MVPFTKPPTRFARELRGPKTTIRSCQRLRRRLFSAKARLQEQAGRLEEEKRERLRVHRRIEDMRRSSEKMLAAGCIARALAQERYGPTSIKPPRTADLVVALGEVCGCMQDEGVRIDLNDAVRIAVLLQRMDLPGRVEVELDLDAVATPAFDAADAGWLVARMVGWAAEVAMRSGGGGRVVVRTRLHSDRVSLAVSPHGAVSRLDGRRFDARAAADLSQVRVLAVQRFGGVLRVCEDAGAPCLTVDLPRRGAMAYDVAA